MEKRLLEVKKILMLSSEATPFSKSGGLADVVGSLSAALADEKFDVRVILPAYNMTSEAAGSPVATVQVEMLGGKAEVEIRRKEVGKVTYYFVCHEVFCSRTGIYGNTSFEPYVDNFSRFVLYSKAALELCRTIEWVPDIFHCHDWAAGLFPYILKNSASEGFEDSCTVFTIHNLAYQGEFAKMEFIEALLPPDPGLFFNDKVNMLRAGLIFSDVITTVSPTYAREIQEPAQGCQMDDILRKRSSDLFGILNGIDLEAWDPGTDPVLPVRYSAGTLDLKARIKAFVQKKFGLEDRPDLPLFVMITRLAWQKGIEAVIECLPDVLEGNRLQFLIIGTGDSSYEDSLREIAARYPNISVNLIFSNEAAHLGEAAGDFFLMPSRYEPCGLNQMYSMRYGTVPVATRTGGLADSITDFETDREGTGLFIREASARDIAEAVGKALSIYRSPDFVTLRHNAASLTDFSWASSTRKYIETYDYALNRKAEKNKAK